MLEFDENQTVLNLPVRNGASLDAQRAYADLLNALHGAIHLNEGREAIDQAIESLMTIAECWAIARETDSGDTRDFPFAKQSEIDLIQTMMGLATYSDPNERDFAELRQAFLEATGQSQAGAERHHAENKKSYHTGI